MNYGDIISESKANKVYDAILHGGGICVPDPAPIKPEWKADVSFGKRNLLSNGCKTMADKALTLDHYGTRFGVEDWKIIELIAEAIPVSERREAKKKMEEKYLKIQKDKVLQGAI